MVVQSYCKQRRAFSFYTRPLLKGPAGERHAEADRVARVRGVLADLAGAKLSPMFTNVLEHAM